MNRAAVRLLPGAFLKQKCVAPPVLFWYTAVMFIQMLYLFLISLAGAFLQTNVGFGLPVIAMLFLPMFLPFSTSVAMYQIVALVSTTWIVVRYRRYVAWRVMLPILVVSLAAGVVMTFQSLRMSNSALIIILGFALVTISVFSVGFSERIRVKPTVPAGLGLGLIAGVGNGLFGIGGPPVAMYLLAGTEDKRGYLATLQTYFLISNLSTIFIRIGSGAIGRVHLPLIAAGWVGIGLGTFLGLKLFEVLPKTLLKKLVYGFVGVSGVWMVVQELVMG